MEKPKRPVSGTDYPGSFREFERWFSSENACHEYVAKLRWPDGFTCPGCGEKPDKPSLMGRGHFLCRKCKRQTSVTAGTLFHGSREPLRTWFLAIWFVTSRNHGVSALELKRILGLGSYNTAWNWLHKLRHAMVRPEKDQLSGEIEVGETYLGGIGTKAVGRDVKPSTIIAIAAEVRGRGMGRIRLGKIPDLSATSLQGFIKDNLQRGSELKTTDWPGYNGLEVIGYQHRRINVANSEDPAYLFMPRLHKVASLLDRWWLGIHQSAIRPSHLDYYLDEFTFRFNRRTSKAGGLLFYRLMEQAVDCPPVPRKMIIGGKSHPAVYG